MRFGLVFLIFMLPTLAEAATACGTYPQIPVKVITVFDEADIKKDVPLARLQAMAGNTVDFIPNNHARKVVLGFTSYTPLVNFNATIRSSTEDGSTTCMVVQDVRSTIGYQNVKVYIANEFPFGSCAYNAIYEHELKHIAVNKTVLEKYADIIRQNLIDQLPIIGVSEQENMAYAEQTLRKKINDMVLQQLTAMREENAARQAEVDSEDEYARVAASCGDDFTRIIKQALGPIASQ